MVSSTCFLAVYMIPGKAQRESHVQPGPTSPSRPRVWRSSPVLAWLLGWSGDPNHLQSNPPWVRLPQKKQLASPQMSLGHGTPRHRKELNIVLISPFSHFTGSLLSGTHPLCSGFLSGCLVVSLVHLFYLRYLPGSEVLQVTELIQGHGPSSRHNQGGFLGGLVWRWGPVQEQLVGNL